MKISELVDKLSVFDQNVEVQLYDDCSGEFFSPDDICCNRHNGSNKAILVFNKETMVIPQIKRELRINQ